MACPEHSQFLKRRGCAFHLVEIFHFVEMRSVFCLYLQNGLEFFNFCVIYKFLDMRWILDSLVSILINEVGQWFYQLDHVTLSKNIFWFVKLYIVRLPNLFHPNVNFKLVERLAFLVRCCTSESISKKSHLITLMMLFIDAIYQEYP